MVELFSDIEGDFMALTLCKRVLACIEHILRFLEETLWDDAPTPYGYDQRQR